MFYLNRHNCGSASTMVSPEGSILWGLITEILTSEKWQKNGVHIAEGMRSWGRAEGEHVKIWMDLIAVFKIYLILLKHVHGWFSSIFTYDIWIKDLVMSVCNIMNMENLIQLDLLQYSIMSEYIHFIHRLSESYSKKIEKKTRRQKKRKT